MQPVMQALPACKLYAVLKKIKGKKKKKRKKENTTHPISENRCMAHVCKQGFDILYPSFISSRQW